MTDDPRRVLRKANELLETFDQVDRIRARRRKYEEDTSMPDQERQQLISRLDEVENGLMEIVKGL